MESILIYLGKSAIATGAFYLAYLVLFQNQKQFTFNRVYLLVSLTVSFFLPLITFTRTETIEMPPLAPVFYGVSDAVPTVAYVPGTTVGWEWQQYLMLFYFVGVAGFLFYLLAGHFKAFAIIRQSISKMLFDAKVKVSKRDIHPFSFFKNIVISNETLSHPNLHLIVEHEKIHVTENHTTDILISEIIFLLQWFNPFAWLIKDAIKNNLEYKTDHQLMQKFDPKTYQLVMVSLAGKTGVAPFLTALNGSQLKNRIVMMKKKTENKYTIVKQLVILPLVAILVMGLANREVKTVIVNPEEINQFDRIKEIIPNEPSKDTTVMGANVKQEALNELNVIEKDATAKWKVTNFKAEINKKDNVIILKPDKEHKMKFELSETMDKAPLVFVDGKEFGKLNEINTLDIAMITIFKKEAAIEKYGTNGKNGVFIIETKSGKKGENENAKKVTGKITNENGEPLIGVNVIIKGTTIGTISDQKGEFSIQLKPEHKYLLFSMVGYETQELETGEKTHLDVILKELGYKTDEVVVTGYGSNKKQTSGFQISSAFKGNGKPIYIVDGIEMKEVTDLNPDNIESVSVLKDGSAIKLYGERAKDGAIIIQTKSGQFRLEPGNPLYVVDGKEFTGNIKSISPNDIETITVLKDKSATILYGDKGKDGVILITTKLKEGNSNLKPAGTTNSLFRVEQSPTGKKYSGRILDKTTNLTVSSVKIYNKWGNIIAETDINGSYSIDSIYINETVYAHLKGFSGSYLKPETKEYTNALKDHYIEPKATETSKNSKNIEGFVKDENGKGIPGVSVLIKNTPYGTITDMKGFFKLKINPEHKTLLFSMIGLEPKEFEIGEKSEIIVILHKSGFKSGKTGITSNNDKDYKTEEAEKQVFFIVEEMPEFPGGEMELRKYIATNIKYPKIAMENGIQGKVYVTFVISKTGKVTDSKISRGIDPSLDKEALRVVNTLPEWKPGKQRGKEVNVSYTVPITFALRGQNLNDPFAKIYSFTGLILVDGKEYNGDIKEIPKTEIAYFSISTGGLEKIWGDKAKNGVMEITLIDRNINITSEKELLKYLTKNLKFPRPQLEQNIEGTSKIWVPIDEKGNIGKYLRTEPENKVKLEEIIVTSVRIPANDRETKLNNDDNIFIFNVEVFRVLRMIPQLNIPSLNGKTIEINVKFMLQ